VADRPFTLIDVMRGIRKHGLIDKMSPQCFTFLIGLILEANELGFKNPIGMSTRQAMSIGGGTSRQTVYSRRQKLELLKIDGVPLLKCDAGSRAHNNVAKYEVNYNLLCSYNGVWAKPDMLKRNYSEADMLKENDSGLYSAVDSAVDSALTIHRSEERRGDNTYPTTINKVSTGEGAVEDSGNGKVDVSIKEPENGNLSYVIHQIQVLFCHGAPIELNSPQYEKAMQISEFDRREIEEALEACEKAKYDLNPTKRPRNSGWILNRLMHPEWFGRGSVAGRRTKAGVLAELKEYRKYLEEVTPMAEANPGEQYLKDMVNESKRMIEKLEAEYGRYKTGDGGGSQEERGDC